MLSAHRIARSCTGDCANGWICPPGFGENDARQRNCWFVQRRLAVPEPSSAILLLAGVAGLLVRRRRR
ncbi:PEP-CTERM sorting domain-containing protein [Gemmatimonas sp.]|uniref:PEP-CTERM sorting domain-containing protein n=1 Tax=Gemmatimonas sp. TaxID=1962908 RepID=UPI0033415696